MGHAWMDIAWAEQGQHEVSGTAANPRIAGYFREIGRADVVSDEIPWCAAFVGRCVHLSGISIEAIPPERRLLARSFATFGTPLDAPRVGALCVISRGSDASQGHVGFVAGWTDDTIVLLGGNQADSVSTAQFSRNRIVALRWPAPAATAAELAKAGSATVARASRQVTDGSVAGVVNALPVPPKLPPADVLVGKATQLQGAVEAVIGFAAFAQSRWGWIVGALSVYFLARMGWDALAIRSARVADHNSGANVSRSTLEAADAGAA